MPKKRVPPERWLPREGKPAGEYTLMEMWSCYHKEIAKFCNFNCPEETIKDYTSALAPIAWALDEKPAALMSAYDVWDGVVSARFKGNGKPYASSTFSKRMAAVNDIYKYAEAMAICCNPIWLSPWDLLGDIDYSENADELREALAETAREVKKKLPRFLSPEQEKKLMEMIAMHITEDGRWVGVLILLWCGARPSEVRGLRYEKLIHFADHPERRYIQFYELLEKERMKNKYSVRDVPEHIEMHYLMQIREEFTRSKMGTEDIGNLPLVCFGNDFQRACTAVELSSFVRQQLKMLFDSQEIGAQALSIFLDPIEDSTAETPADASADLEIAARMLRRNFSTKNYAESQLKDTQSRLAMGHKTECAEACPYSENHLWEMLQRMDHRMILPECHLGWNTVLVPGQHEIVDTGIHHFKIPREVMLQGAEINGYVFLNELGDALCLELKKVLPPGVEIEIEPIYQSKAELPKDRLNTDYAHWPLPKWPDF